MEHATTVPAEIWTVQSMSDTIRVDGTSPRGRGQEDVKESDKGVLSSECSKVKYKAKPLSGMLS